MKNVNLPVWLLLLLAILVIGLSLATAFSWRRGNNLRGDVAGIEEQLSDARKSKQELDNELRRLRDINNRIGSELGNAQKELERSRIRVSKLEDELRRSRESSTAVGAAVAGIADWIRRVEEENPEAEG